MYTAQTSIIIIVVLASAFIFGIYIAFRSLRTRCPRCHSINTRKRRSSHRYRTHRCRQCNIAFAPKLKPRWDVHLIGDDDQPGYAGESLSSVLGE